MLTEKNNQIDRVHSIQSDVDTMASNWDTQLASNPFPEFDGYAPHGTPTDTFLHRFARQVVSTPQAPAVVFEGSILTYHELDTRSNQIANFLKSAGITKGHAVALCLHPSLQTAAAFIGIWKAGAAYVPLDPDLPASRLAHIIKQTQAKAAIAGNETSDIVQLAETGCLAHVDDPASPVWEQSDKPPQIAPLPEDIAYVIYTSGSTGMPKGVAIRHGSITDYIDGLIGHLPQFAQSRNFALGSPIYTDLGNTVLYGALLNGGTLHLFAKELFNDFAYANAYFQENSIDCLKIVPSHWKFLSDGKNALIPHKLLIFGGEKLPSSFVREVHETNPGCTVVNHYGPTETTIGKLLHVTDPTCEYGHTVPIGKPFSNTSVYVLDEYMRHCPVGTPGELHIGGAGLAEQYLGEPELTRNAFVNVTDKNGHAQRVYRTGDIVRWLPDGNIEYIERRDGQVKIRGNRIELAEIEHQLRALPGVRDAVASVWEEMPGTPTLAAYIVGEAFLPQAEVPPALTAAWRRQLLAHLPHYMVPSAWIAIGHIPLNGNNKADRKALPTPQRRKRQAKEADYSAYSPSQQLAAAAWSHVLKRDYLDLDDDFFELGGHSLLAMQVLTFITRETGDRLPISSLFRRPTLREFSTLLEDGYPKSAPVKATSQPMGPSSPGQDTDMYRVPLIDPQREIWLSCELGGEEANLAYNQSLTLTLQGDLDMESMCRAITAVVGRHDALRAHVDEDGESMTVCTEASTTLVVIDEFADLPADARHASFEAFVKREMRKPFNLIDGPLFRAYLHTLDKSMYRLTIVVHHIICDAAAMRVLVQDIAAFYNAFAFGVSPDLPPAPQIGDYASAHLAFSNSEAHKATLDYWLSQHRERETILNLPLDFKRPSTRTYAGESAGHTMGESTYQRVKALAAKASTSIATTLTSIIEVLLHHRTGQDEITLGLTTAGQYITGHDEIVGHCVNLLPLRATIDPSQPFLQYLKERKDAIYTVYEHQRLTFSELLKALNIKRDRSQIPLIPFVITIQADGGPIAEFNGLDLAVSPNPRASHTFEIFVNINIDSQRHAIHCQWAYNAQLFSRETIQRMMKELELLIETVTVDPAVTIAQSLPLPHPFPTLEDYRCDYPKDTTMVDHFVNQARKTPQETALLFEGQEMAYATLDEKSNQLANFLVEKGVSAGELIVLCIRPSMEMIIALLGIWKAGAAYVPVDTDLPYERIRYIIEKTQSRMLVTDSETARRHPLATNVEAILLDDVACPIWSAANIQPRVAISPEQPAYVIYTSGSTGSPKGVIIHHRALIDYHFGLIKHLPQLAACKDFALGSPIYTDQGNTVHYAALTNGARLHLFSKEDFNDPNHISAYFNEHPIDYLKIGPARWKYLADAGAKLIPNQLLMFGGETLPPRMLQEVLDSHPQCTVVNHYGPTETTIGKLLHIVDSKASYKSAVPIGKPFSNARILVRDANGTNCPIGVPGELYIGGSGLAQGYLGEPELTDKAFVTIPEQDGERFYKTGDIVRWLPTGDIEYIGRNDDQAKIRGNRVELGEIQNAIHQLNAVRKCAVLAVTVRGSEDEIAAYIVPRSDACFDKETVIQLLRKVLPEYMIPRIWTTVPEIPLTSNGKVDKKALLDFGFEPETNTHVFVPATTPTQEKLVQFWSSCLGSDMPIGITHDFFELGGHSLAAVRVMGQLRQHFGLRLPLATLFEHPTIEKLAKVIDEGIDPLQWDCVIPIRASGSKPPLFIVHGALLDILYVRNLLPYLDPDQPLYGVQGMGLSGKTTVAHTVEEIAGHYVSQLIGHTPSTTVALAGYSSGGVIAYEMARQLRNRGKTVVFLGFFDSFATTGMQSRFRGWVKFWKGVIKEAIRQYGSFHTALFLTLILADNVLGKTIGKLGATSYRRAFPSDYWKSKAQLTHILALKRHRPEPIDIRAVLFKGTRTAVGGVANDTNGWSELLKSGLEVVNITGSHFNMFTPENVEDLALKLQEKLNESSFPTHRMSNI